MTEAEKQEADWLTFRAKIIDAHRRAHSKMAADDESDKSTFERVTCPKMLKTDNFQRREYTDYTDFTCPICLQILIEPVVMPCDHEVCGPCFKQNVEEANFLCPLCRMRISSWARRNSRNGTLVNVKRWEQIQKLFPDRCQKRLRGEDDEDLLGKCIYFSFSFVIYTEPSG